MEGLHRLKKVYQQQVEEEGQVLVGNEKRGGGKIVPPPAFHSHSAATVFRIVNFSIPD